MNCYWTKPRQDWQYIGVAGKKGQISSANMGTLPPANCPYGTCVTTRPKTKQGRAQPAWSFVASVLFDLALPLGLCVCVCVPRLETFFS